MRQRITDRGALLALQNYFSKIQIADKDGDLDRDPYTSDAWYNDTFSNGATGTINWQTAFSLPEKPKMVFIAVDVRDVDSSGGNYFIDFQAKSTTTEYSMKARAERAANDAPRTSHGCVPVADDGTSYYAVTASGANAMDVWIRLIAWIR